MVTTARLARCRAIARETRHWPTGVRVRVAVGFAVGMSVGGVIGVALISIASAPRLR